MSTTTSINSGLYLIHFETPYKHAQHYLGYVRNINKLYKRLQKHKSGTGARLIQVIQQEGIEWTLARVWKEATQADERRLKNNGSSRRYCPICNQWHDMMPHTRSKKLQEFIKAN